MTAEQERAPRTRRETPPDVLVQLRSGSRVPTPSQREIEASWSRIQRALATPERERREPRRDDRA